MELSDNSIDFGTFYNCNLPGPRTIRVSNPGEDDLEVYSFTPPSGFSSSWHRGVISAGTSVDVDISFTGSTGTHGGTFSINSNLTSGTSTVSVNAVYAPSGTQRTIELSDYSLTFPVSFSHKTVMIKNIGDECLNITGFSSSPTQDQNWDVSVTNATLAPGESTTMRITRKGTVPADITVFSNKNGGNAVIHVSQ